MGGELIMITNSGGNYYIGHALPMVKNNASFKLWYNMENSEIL